MGIRSLLRLMKPHIEPIHIEKYAGKRVGIDAYCWLHKGAYSCNMELCLNMEGDKKFQYLNYFMHRINLLRHHKITPVVVLDGGNIPCKAATCLERSRKRKANLDLAVAKFKEGNVTAATELFKMAVSITTTMAHQLIQILRSENIEFLVAPYEADAQLAYLSKLEAEKGGIVAVISEDSDLLAYGCPSVVFKMDRYGNGEEIVLNKVFESATCVPSFRHFDMELFTGMCILAGCDFLPSVPGIGISKAYDLVSKYRNLDRALSILRTKKGNEMPEDYSKSFREAVAVFQHARIYDPDTESLKHLKPLPQKLLQTLDEDLNFLGPDMPPSIAAAVAKGNLDPITMEAFDHFPTSRILLKPSAETITFDRLPRQDFISISTDESSFSYISFPKAAEEISTITTMNESNCLNDAEALEKLLCPSSTQPAEECQSAKQETPLKFPNNNPFRKRKYAKVELDQLENVRTEQVSAVSQVENSEDLCMSATPEKQERVNSKAVKTGGGKKRSPKNDQLENVTTEQVSVVSQVENSENLCFTVTPESQESVNSKTVKTGGRKKRAPQNDKLVRSICESSQKKKGSILNFFSPA